MPERKPVPQMDDAEFHEIIRRLGREELITMVSFLRGWTPDGTEAALACAERVQRLVAEKRAARAGS